MYPEVVGRLDEEPVVDRSHETTAADTGPCVRPPSSSRQREALSPFSKPTVSSGRLVACLRRVLQSPLWMYARATCPAWKFIHLPLLCRDDDAEWLFGRYPNGTGRFAFLGTLYVENTMNPSKKTCISSARLSLEDYSKLRHLAEATGRTKSSVIRVLIRLADVEDLRQIRLATTRRNGSGDEAAEVDDV